MKPIHKKPIECISVAHFLIIFCFQSSRKLSFFLSERKMLNLNQNTAIYKTHFILKFQYSFFVFLFFHEKSNDFLPICTIWARNYRNQFRLKSRNQWTRYCVTICCKYWRQPDHWVWVKFVNREQLNSKTKKHKKWTEKMRCPNPCYLRSFHWNSAEIHHQIYIPPTFYNPNSLKSLHWRPNK